MKLTTGCIIKIPDNIKVVYCDKTCIGSFIGPSKKKAVRFDLKVLFSKGKSYLMVTNVPSKPRSAVFVKNARKLQGTVIGMLKHLFVEILFTVFHKLKFVGVGYRAFHHEKNNRQVYFKLGYSHLVYFILSNGLGCVCKKFTKLTVFGNCSYNYLREMTSLIRNCRPPEPYKGKGILNLNEIIRLKKGKKI